MVYMGRPRKVFIDINTKEFLFTNGLNIDIVSNNIYLIFSLVWSLPAQLTLLRLCQAVSLFNLTFP